MFLFPLDLSLRKLDCISLHSFNLYVFLFFRFPYNRDNTSVIAALRAAANDDPRIILIWCENNNEGRYNAIKKEACLHRAIPTQIITANAAGRNLSVATKVVLQMHTKLGRAPWGVKIPLTKLMVCGYDISKEGKTSFGAFVAALDIKENPTKHFSIAQEHKAQENASDAFSMFMMSALRAYKEYHKGDLPNKIIMYRDGVSEGQLEHLIASELDPLKELLRKIYKDVPEGEPRFTYIVVNKKINTRIFAKGNRGYENPPCGTVVDNTITLPERYDFFLVSQRTKQGTVAPTSYNVLEDTIQLPAAKMQMITYKLCQLYYNWNGSVRVPAVCQYAKKLALLCAKHLKQAPNDDFNNKLYFL